MRFNCDGCGNPINGNGHQVVDENFNVQEGMLYCTDCKFGSDEGIDTEISVVMKRSGRLQERCLRDIIGYGRHRRMTFDEALAYLAGIGFKNDELLSQTATVISCPDARFTIQIK